MKRILLLLTLVLSGFSLFAQSYGNFRQLRFFVVTSASDTAATVANSGRMWYDFNTDHFRCNINGINSDLGGSGGATGDFVSTSGVSDVIIAAGILRPVSTGTGGSAITWQILDPVTGHNSIYFTGVTTVGSNIVVSWPTVLNVINFTCTSDETLAANGIRVGASVGTSTATISGSMNSGVFGGWLRGNGGGTFFDKFGNLSLFDMQLVDAGRVNFNAPLLLNSGTLAQNAQFQQGIAINYVGDNNYRIRRILGGLGAYNFGFEIIDNATNAKITTNSSVDIIDIMATTPKSTALNLNINDSSGFPYSLLGSSGNIWIIALFQL